MTYGKPKLSWCKNEMISVRNHLRSLGSLISWQGFDVTSFTAHSNTSGYLNPLVLSLTIPMYIDLSRSKYVAGLGSKTNIAQQDKGRCLWCVSFSKLCAINMRPNKLMWCSRLSSSLNVSMKLIFESSGTEFLPLWGTTYIKVDPIYLNLE